MALVLSATSTRNGIIELIEDYTNTESSTTSSYPKLSKTRDINLAFANYMRIAVRASGRWQVDDNNQTDYPIILMDLVANQSDYSFNYDGSTVPNQILDIHRVEILDNSDNPQLLKPIDQDDIESIALTAYEDTAGTPNSYDKTSNALWLYPAPSYNKTGGLRIYASRTPVYFLGDGTDDDNKAGIPEMFHEYLALRPAYFYCLSKGLPQTKALKEMLDEKEKDIKAYYGTRQRDEPVGFEVDNSHALDTRKWT